MPLADREAGVFGRRTVESQAGRSRHAHPMTAKKRLAILISGRGSNMMALVEATRAADYPAETVVVISNRPDASGLAWARQRGIAVRAIDHKAFADREAFEAELHEALIEARAEIVCLAGFMRLLTASFVERWSGRMLNIHPSLLPAFKGTHTHERALAAGVKIAGCTVHFVVPEMDSGPIVAQAAVPVVEGDTPDTLADRILAAEHGLYPLALRLVASGSARLDGDRVIVPAGAGWGQLLSPELR
jgi:phosphoribosylglycinamide formyltransferase-1